MAQKTIHYYIRNTAFQRTERLVLVSEIKENVTEKSRDLKELQVADKRSKDSISEEGAVCAKQRGRQARCVHGALGRPDSKGEED